MSEIVDFSPESDEFDEMDADLEDYIGKKVSGLLSERKKTFDGS